MKSILSIAISCAVLSGCGGGSDSDSSTFPAVSDFSPIQLDSENASDTVSAAFEGVGGVSDAEGTGLELNDEATSSSNGIALAQMFAEQYLSSSSEQPLEAIQSDSESFDCDVSGSISLQAQGDLTIEGSSLQATYNSCVESDMTITGSLRIDIFANSSDDADLKFTFSDLTVADSLETSTLNGDLRLTLQISETIQTNTISSDQLNVLSSVSGNEVISALRLEAVLDSDSAPSTLEMAFELASDELGGRLTFTTPELMRFSGTETDNPTTGIFEVTGASGSSVTLNADTGDTATVLFTLFDGSSTTSDTVSWASIDGSELSVVADF